MFSKMIAGLRNEAEKVSASNYERLLTTVSAKDKNFGYLHDVSGKARADRTLFSGGILGATGIVGIIGLAAANQAAGLAVAGVSGLAGTSALAGISTALAGLGTVAVGATVLPVATVAALGAAVAGIVVMAVGKAMPVDFDKGREVGQALKNEDKEALGQFGRDHVGISDWLKGAKNLVVNSLKDRFAGEKSIESPVKSASPAGLDASGVGSPAPNGDKPANAFDDYYISDLFDYPEGKQKLVDRIGEAALFKFDVILDPAKTHEALNQSRGNVSFSGKILAVNEKSGLVLMSSGRGGASVHNLRDFGQTPVIGQITDISYKQGKIQNVKDGGRMVEDKAQEKSLGR